MDNKSLKKQMPKNLTLNLLSFLTNVLIGLWIIPYLVGHIGVAAYGLVPLAMFFSAYVSVIVQSLNSVVNRFLLIAIHKNNTNEANEIFNTSLIIMLIFIFIQSTIMSVIILNLSYLLDIPLGLKEDAFWLFLLTFIGFSFSLLRGIFATPIFAQNRLDILRSLDIIQILSRTAIIIILFSFNNPELIYVGIANLCGALIVFIQTLYFNRKLAPELKINFTLFNKTRVKELSHMGGWVLINQIGSLLFLKIDLFLANKFLGASIAGEYAIVLQWNMLIRVFAGLLSGVLTPITMILYAKGERVNLIKMLKITFKLMSIGMAIIIGILTALSGDILSIWMGENFRHLETLMTLSLLPLVINLAVYPLFAVQTAYNKVKIPGIVTLLLGLANLLLAILLLQWTTLGLYAIVLAGVIILTLKNTFFTPIYASYLLKIPSFSFIKYYIYGIAFYIVSYIFTSFISAFYQIDGYITLILVAILSLISSLLIFFVYLKFDEDLYSLIIKIVQKKGKK